jgi:hypothetical protein
MAFGLIGKVCWYGGLSEMCIKILQVELNSSGYVSTAALRGRVQCTPFRRGGAQWQHAVRPMAVVMAGLQSWRGG